MTFLISFGPGREYFLRVQSTSVELVQAPINLNIMERLVMNADAAKHVQAYIEYEQIVGNADGGKMMSEAEFEAYKQQVKEARKNRLYVHWRNTGTGQDCKTIGPASQCFCGHRYKQHNHDNVKTRQINCQEPKCKCKMFTYIPIFGS